MLRTFLLMQLPLCGIAFAEPVVAISSANGSVQVQAIPADVVKQNLTGCTCGFSGPNVKGSPSIDLIIGWGLSDTTAFMQINGKTERFQVFAMPSVPRQTTKPKKREPTIADQSDWLVRGNIGQVVLHTKVSQTCWAHTECESIGYAGTAKVSIAGNNLSFRVEGWCGC